MKAISTARRLMMFNAVGVAGFVVQTAALWLLIDVGGMSVLFATAAAVEAAVLHNFVVHVRWTWSDRPADRRTTLARLARFNLSNGAVSIGVNVGVMALLQRVPGIHYLLANVVGVACGSAVNFVLGDLVVFTTRSLAKGDAAPAPVPPGVGAAAEPLQIISDPGSHASAIRRLSPVLGRRSSTCQAQTPGTRSGSSLAWCASPPPPAPRSR